MRVSKNSLSHKEPSPDLRISQGFAMYKIKMLKRHYLLETSFSLPASMRSRNLKTSR